MFTKFMPSMLSTYYAVKRMDKVPIFIELYFQCRRQKVKNKGIPESDKCCKENRMERWDNLLEEATSELRPE